MSEKLILHELLSLVIEDVLILNELIIVQKFRKNCQVHQIINELYCAARDGRAMDQGRKESRRKRITCDKHRDKSLDTELGIRASCVTDMQQVASNGVTPVSHRSANGEPPRIKSFLNVLTIAVRLLFGPIQTEV